MSAFSQIIYAVSQSKKHIPVSAAAGLASDIPVAHPSRTALVISETVTKEPFIYTFTFLSTSLAYKMSEQKIVKIDL